MVMGLLQAEWIPDVLGLGLNEPGTWIIVVVVGIALGRAHRRAPGIRDRLHRRPIVHRDPRRAAHLARCRLCARERPDDRPARPAPSSSSAAGREGSLGATLSWVVAGIVIIAIAIGLVANRRRRRRYGFPVRPVWADVTIGVVGEPPGRDRRLDRQRLRMAPGAGRAVRHRERDRDSAGRARHPDRHRESRSSSRSASPSSWPSSPRDADSDATCTPSVATPRPRCSPASTRAGRS